MARLRVLVVDDSAFMRKIVTQVLEEHPDIEVIGACRDGQEAINRVAIDRPDVVTMDVEMPTMDGLAALQRIMATHPTPVVMLSSVTQTGALITMKCFAAGAVDAVAKPSGSTSLDLPKIGRELIAAVLGAACANVRPSAARIAAPIPKLEARTKLGLILIGCSTGGPKALQTLAPHLKAEWNVPIVVVQHMPAHFTASLAARLDGMSNVNFREAKLGDKLEPGVALLAPGGLHLVFDSMGHAHTNEAPPLHGVRPAVDATIASLVETRGAHTLGILLTGMGRDGAAGLKAIREKGGHTLVEHESTCVVYGMPKAAVELGAAEQIVPLPDIPAAIEGLLQSARRRAA